MLSGVVRRMPDDFHRAWAVGPQVLAYVNGMWIDVQYSFVYVRWLSFGHPTTNRPGCPPARL